MGRLTLPPINVDIFEDVPTANIKVMASGVDPDTGDVITEEAAISKYAFDSYELEYYKSGKSMQDHLIEQITDQTVQKVQRRLMDRHPELSAKNFGRPEYLMSKDYRYANNSSVSKNIHPTKEESWLNERVQEICRTGVFR
jgi:hypothetical protein